MKAKLSNDLEMSVTLSEIQTVRIYLNYLYCMPIIDFANLLFKNCFKCQKKFQVTKTN